MGRIGEILEGWRNHLLPPEELKELIDVVSQERLSICTPCEYNSTPGTIKMFSKCRKCGCPLIQKSKSLQTSCPINKWGPVTTKEEEQEIKSAINGEKDGPKSSSMETNDSH